MTRFSTRIPAAWLPFFLLLCLATPTLGAETAEAGAPQPAETIAPLAALGLERHTLDTAAGPLVYWTGGEGKVIVLLHGAGHQAATWAAVVETLSRQFTVVIPDLPGHGESAPAEGPLPFDKVYGGLDALLANLEGDRRPYALIGNSMGAWLSEVYAHRNPGAVSRVVVVNGGALYNPTGEISLTPGTREEARRTMSYLRDPSSPPIPDAVLDNLAARASTGPLARMLQAPMSFAPFFLDNRLGEITTPVNLVWGRSDQLMTLDYARRQLEALPRAELHPIERCGHIPQAECPDRFVKLLLQVLSAPPPPAAAPPAAEAAKGNS